MKGHFLILLLAVSLVGVAAEAQVFNLSGGGTNLIANIIENASDTGGTIFITDSGTYTETQNLFVGPRYNATDGRRSFNIEAALGTNPTIQINGGGMIMYAGSADLHIGSATGGEINIDILNTTLPGTLGAFWYIGQEDGLASGTACQVLFENLEIDYTGSLLGPAQEGFIFGAGGNDGAPNTTGASLTYRDVTSIGAVFAIRHLYAPANYDSTINLEYSRIIDPLLWGIDYGALLLIGPGSVINLDHTIMYTSPAVVSADANAIVQFQGNLIIDHCDIVTESTGPVDRAITVTLFAEDTIITNSIIHGDAGTIDFQGGAFTRTVTDSNVTSRTVSNVGFTYTNVLETESLGGTYITYGLNFADDNNFRVLPTAQSYTWGADPPVGSRGAGPPPPSSIGEWALYE